jgi:hypothetical protein
MQSDPRVARALEALALPIAEFRALVQGALFQTERYLAAQAADTDARSAAARTELGSFATPHLDAAGFAALFPRIEAAGPAIIAAARAAADILANVHARGEEIFTTAVPAGGRLGDTVNAALAQAGRAFGAVVVSELVRAGRYRTEEHRHLLDGFEFRAWTRTERRFAPPLVVVLDGADMRASELVSFTDGREKVVLVVQGPCAPAPLARCITPGTLVLQTADGSGLDRLAAFDGPAIAAMVPDGAALFLHEPTAGRETWQRLTVKQMPVAPTRSIGGMSAWQMGEDLRLLADLAATPFALPLAAGAAAGRAVGASDAAERIATWLLGESGLAGGA